MTQAYQTSAVAALAAIADGTISARDLTAHFLDRIAADNGRINALRHVLADEALVAAEAIDAKVAAGDVLPPLAGLPVVVKENCDVAGVPCSAGLAFRNGHVPDRDAEITKRLRDAGAIVLGVSISDPGAFSVRTDAVTHPLDPELVVGGSSGGSGAALAAGFCLGAIGTDTGGSIRIPSACCGTAGLKPTFDALPMDGIFPLVQSLDHVGPMALNVEDTRVIWNALSGQAGAETKRIKRVGFDPAWVEIADQPIRDAVAMAKAALIEQGIEIVEIKLPDRHDLLAMHGEIFMVEAAAFHCSLYPENTIDYPELAQDWFEIARSMPVGTYVDAWTKRVAMRNAVNTIFESVDAIIAPTLCVARPAKHDTSLMVAGVETDYTMALAWLPCLFDETGHPALAFSVADAPDPLSASVQIVGPHGGEDTVFSLARKIAAH